MIEKPNKRNPIYCWLQIRPLSVFWHECICQMFLWIFIVTYIILFTRNSFYLYNRFALTAYDLGIFDQAVWLISHGYKAFDTVRGMHILGDHFNIILFLLAPFYWIWDSPRMLLFIQTVVLASGALPVYGLTRRVTGSSLIGLFFAVTYLLYPAIQFSNTFDFHPEPLATPMLLGAFYYLKSHKWVGYFILLGLASLTKETMGLTIVLLGIYALWINRKIGLMTIMIGVVALPLSLISVRYFNHGLPSPYYSLYSNYGGTPLEVSAYLLNHPSSAISSLNNYQNRSFLSQLLQPVVYLPFLAPEVLLLALPGILADILSSRSAMHEILYQYTAFITPFILASAIVGFDRWRRWGNRFSTNLLLLYTAGSVLYSAQVSPLVHMGEGLPAPVSATVAMEVRCILQSIPANESISAQAGLLPHVSHRLHVYTFPNPFYSSAWGGTVRSLKQEEGKGYPVAFPKKQITGAINCAPVDYIVLCPDTSYFPLSLHWYLDSCTAVLRSPVYGIIKVNNNAILLKHGADHKSGLNMLANQVGEIMAKNGDEIKLYQLWSGMILQNRESSQKHPIFVK